MNIRPTLDDLKDHGSGLAAPQGVVRLYHHAFSEFGTRALWNWKRLERPTITQALTIADALWVEGNLAARQLAVEIEQACRAALSPAE
jgi:hypothetical protein